MDKGKQMVNIVTSNSGFLTDEGMAFYLPGFPVGGWDRNKQVFYKDLLFLGVNSLTFIKMH